MKTQDEILGDLFRSAFDGLEKQPSEAVWKNISSHVNQPPVSPVKTDLPRKFWYYAAGGAAMLTITGIIAFSLLRSPDQVNDDNSTPGKNTTIAVEQKDSKFAIDQEIIITAEEQETMISSTEESQDFSKVNEIDTDDASRESSYVEEIAVIEPKTGNKLDTPVKRTNQVDMERINEDVTKSYYSDSKGEQPEPKPLYLPEDTVVCSGEEIRLKSGGATSYLWNTGEMSPEIRVSPESSTYYSLTLTTNDDTEIVHHVLVEVRECATLFIPDAFSPNGDGRNDEFIAFGINVRHFHMRIFSANGQLMFESRDINHGWDGRYKGGDAPGDVYFYVVNFTDNNGKQYARQGRLFLLR